MPVETITDAEKAARLRLNAAACLRGDWAMRLIDLYGSAQEALGVSPWDLAAEGGLTFTGAQRALREAAAHDPEKEISRCASMGISLVFDGTPEYPAALRDLADRPLVIYMRGKLEGRAPVGMVGTRLPTPYGRRMAARIASDLAGAGATVVSGLARGVDTICHEAAVKAEAKTWAVVGTGLDSCYPLENRRLADKIVETGGAVLSELPLGSGPMPAHFPRRNRIIAGLSLATVVIEGGFASGALITARFALEYGRDVLALPGPADSDMSRGPNKLLKDGAAPVEGAADVLAALPPEVLAGLKSARRRAARRARKGPDGDPGEVFATVTAAKDEGVTADALVERLGWTVPRAAAAIFELEALGFISQTAGKYFPQE